MRSSTWNILLCVMALALSVFILRQSHTTELLKKEAVALRATIQRMNTSWIESERRREEARIKAQEATAAAQAALEENQAEAGRLRATIERLKAEIAVPPPLTRPKGRTPESGSTYTLSDILNEALLGNTHRVADLITFEPGDEAQAEALFAQLPAETQVQYESARHLVASIVALTIFPKTATGNKLPAAPPTISEDKKTATYQIQLRRKGGDLPPITCVFRRADGTKNDWFLVVSPEMMASYRQAVAEAAQKR